MITASKRMLRKESEVKSGTNEVYSDRKNSVAVTFRYETIVVGDAFCGKSTYLTLLAENEINSNSPVMLSQDRCEYEFWVEFKNKKAVFMVKDTANQERFRSLTQSYYRKAQCVLLMFDSKNHESFNSLSKWHSDVMSYCKKQDDKFAIILVGLKRKKRNTNNFTVDLEQIEKFQQEHEFVIDYTEIDLESEHIENVKEPFQLLLEHFVSLNDSKILPTNYFETNKSNNDSNTINITQSNIRKKSLARSATPFNHDYNETGEEDNDLKENNKSCCIII